MRVGRLEMFTVGGSEANTRQNKPTQGKPEALHISQSKKVISANGTY